MQNRTSRTAEQVALFRALETARGDGIVHDPYAARFLPPGYRVVAGLARIPPVGHRVERWIDGRWPGGPRGSAVVRTRLIDDLVSAALVDGAGQVLLLGAGYDSRAYRIPAMAAVPVFEVDHPATQATKRRLVAAHVRAERRAHVRLVPVDFLHDDLRTELAAAGFVESARTVVVWEGVTNYLTAESVDATLRRLAAATAPGSRIVLTYVDRAALDGTGEFTGVDGWHATVRRGGEPWTFGFSPADLPAYLAERGLHLRRDESTRDAAARYLDPIGRHDPTAAFYRVAEIGVG
jgi:methyltransferase (TIGR00027 family)